MVKTEDEYIASQGLNRIPQQHPKTPAMGSHPHNAPKENKTNILTTSPPKSTLQSGLTHLAGRDKQLQIQQYKRKFNFITILSSFFIQDNQMNSFLINLGLQSKQENKYYQ